MPPPDILPAVRSFLKLFYSHLYGIPMKWEPDGDNITWCEGSPSNKGSLVLKGVPHQPLLPDSICAMWERWPDRWSPTCPLVLQSMIPAVVHKAIFLASHPGARALDLQALVEGCGYKGCPWSWWWLPIRLRMKDLNLLSDVTLVRQWNSVLHDLWLRGELPDSVTFWELDIVAMFPNLSRDRVWAAIQEIFDIVHRTRRMRAQLRFAINKIDKKLDRIGGGSPELFTNFTKQQVLDFVYFDIYCNDLFVYLNAVYRQVRGIAIGPGESFCPTMRSHRR